MVLDVASNEELQRTMFMVPSMPLANRNVRLLTEIESIVNSMPRKPVLWLDVVVEHELPLF
jgi:hypothetical protein